MNQIEPLLYIISGSLKSYKCKNHSEGEGASKTENSSDLTKLCTLSIQIELILHLGWGGGMVIEGGGGDVHESGIGLMG